MVYFLLIRNDHIPSTPECIEAYFEPLVRLSLSVWSIFCHSTSHAKSSTLWTTTTYFEQGWCDVCFSATILKMIGLLLLLTYLPNLFRSYFFKYYLPIIVANIFQLFLFTFSGRCENGNPCAQNCYNIHNEMYECECHHGFVLSDNGYSCIGKHVLWF